MIRTAVVTGASRGIGAAIALRCARDGYAVVVNFSQDAAGAAEVVETVRESGGVAVSVQADVSNPDQVVALFDAAETIGIVSAVINNAGITGDRIGVLSEMPPEVLARVTEVNVNGPLLVCREAIRRMARDLGGQGGQIINISSTAARHGSPNTWVHYAATKGAIDVLTVGLAAEVATRGIRVNAVSPGSTNTGLHAAAGMPDRVERLASTIPLGRGAEPSEIANAVSWLLSDEAAYVTGVVLPVSGGR